MKVVRDRARIRVPATSANLGPGFDSFGLALALFDEIDAEAVTGRSSVEVVGEGAGQVPTDEDHLVVRAIHAGLEWMGAPLVGVRLTCRNAIPHGRGLGSSAAAVVGGLTIARELAGGRGALSDADMLVLATEFEGHPDNAAPAILGGFTVSWLDAADGRPRATALTIDPSFEPIVCVPAGQLATTLARSALPDRIPIDAAVFNLSRAGLLVAALGERPELLIPATEDAIHQDHRRDVMPDTLALVDMLRAEGMPAVVSGAGPSVLVLARRPDDDLVPGVSTVRAIAGAQWSVGRCEIARIGAARR